MVTRPAVHQATATVGELRSFFADDHVHMALLVDDGEIVAAIERDDLIGSSDAAPARNIATLDGRTIRDDATLADAYALLGRTGRRRLAVTTDESILAGLLCLKASGQGFCSDEDVASRQGLVRVDAARDSLVL
jgi:predicted transcriptional regulator